MGYYGTPNDYGNLHISDVWGLRTPQFCAATTLQRERRRHTKPLWRHCGDVGNMLGKHWENPRKIEVFMGQRWENMVKLWLMMVHDG